MSTERKKLIEVALPLEAINKAAAREKSIRHGHPSTLHLWWARRPLAACRAVLFASIIDDPGQPGVPQALLDAIDRLPAPAARGAGWLTMDETERRRQKLFAFIERLVQWENSTNEEVIGAARRLIQAATGGNPPPVLDPFCGGGSIPLEAQRLGLEAHASDLNPVAVLITKALIEIPPRFAGRPPVNPERRRTGAGAAWKGAAGLAEDVRFYGRWMRDEAERRIGHLYPKVTLPKAYGGGAATVIAWLWARTVRCPNPACGAQMPLVSSFWLSKKDGRKAWAEPVVDRSTPPPTIRFTVSGGVGQPPDPPKLGRGARFRCLACGQVAPEQHIKDEGKAGRMGAQMMAIVAEGQRGRVYLPPTPEHEAVAAQAQPGWIPDQPLAGDPRSIWCVGYGLDTFGKLFTPRQLVALTTFSDLVGEARERVRADAVAAGVADDGVGLEAGGTGAAAYADAIATYLAFAVDKAIDRNTSLCSWESGMDRIRGTFGRQALPVVWDFAETNPFAGAGGDIAGTVQSLCEVLDVLRPMGRATVLQLDATSAKVLDPVSLVSTDPPYYDNIGYSDLSDFFYIWLRRSLNAAFPQMFRTMLVPKSQELVATPYRFGRDRDKARKFFEGGLSNAFAHLCAAAHPDFPVTVYYAFKQAEADSGEAADWNGNTALASTGWETMLEGVIKAGFTITGTWPIRSELTTRNVGRGTNALASSIVLVCRPRPENAPLTTRRDFLNALQRELPAALRDLQRGNIAPVDLAQASIGPGMAIFSRYSKVLEADGSPMRVRTALALINQALDAYLTEQEAEYDPDTRWAIAWFEQYGFNEGPYGDAETLSKAKNTSVQGMVEAGIVTARAGKVRLLRRAELPADWNPASDPRLTVWEMTEQLVRALDTGGEQAAASLLARAGGRGEIARDLAYRLYQVCERKGWAQEALAYNSLVIAWPEIGRQAGERQAGTPEQARLIE